MAVGGAIVVSLAVAVAVFRIFFRDRDDFAKCVEYALVPDVFSLFRGRLMQDWEHSLRLSVYIMVSMGAGIGAYHFICKFSGE
jgi:hypothetical protein